MIATLVPDASVVVKVFLQEADSAAARALIGAGHAGAGHALAGPEIVAVEAASAVLRRFRMGGLSRADSERALNDVRRFMMRGVSLTPNASLQPRAEEIALDLKYALKDCLYVALAERLGCPFVTADATLVARAARQFPFVQAF